LTAKARFVGILSAVCIGNLSFFAQAAIIMGARADKTYITYGICVL
jgi:hypothetical protein